MVFAILAIPFALTIINGTYFENPSGQYLESVSSISLILFIVTTLIFSTASYTSSRSLGSKTAFEAAIKQLSRSLGVRFKKNASMTGPVYEATYRGMKMTVGLLGGGGTTIASNFLNVTFYHKYNLNLGLTLRSKYVTLLFKDEYRDVMARPVRSGTSVLDLLDAYAIRNSVAETIFNNDKVMESISNILDHFKAIGVASGASDKLLGIGSGVVVNDKYVCIRVLEDILDKAGTEHLARLALEAYKLSKSIAQPNLVPGLQKLVPAT